MYRPDLIIEFDSRPGSLAVKFPYDPLAVSLVKTVPGRRYDKDTKVWYIPSGSLRALQQEAARRGFNIVLSERLRLAQNHGQQDKAELRRAKETNDSPMDLPTKTDARPYQRAGIRYLQMALRKFKGALLADDMGLGKTFQALSLVALSRCHSVLVLAPASVKYVWAEEIEKHYPDMSYVVIDGVEEERREQWARDVRIFITNYELIIPRRRQDEDGEWEHIPTPEDAARIRQWDLVIPDEITKLKNYTTQTAKTVKRLYRVYSLGLSGAPIENRLDDLHSIMDFVMPGLLGPGWLFHQEHCILNRYGGVVGYRGIEGVRARIAPHYLRRTKDKVLKDLPPKTYTDVWLEMNHGEWAVYGVIIKQIRAAIKENPKLRAANILTEILRLKQCVDDTRLLGETGITSSKVEALRDILEASEGHKIVAFTQFAEWATLLGEEFGAPVLKGEVPAKARAAMISQFQQDDSPLLVCTEAGAYGITLTAADIVVHLDQPWNPARLRQREDRLHRLGQKGNVQVVSFIARRTVDELVRRIIHRKLKLLQDVFHEDADDVVAAQAVSRADLISLLGAD